MIYNFKNTYTDLSEKLYQKVSAPDIADPEIILLNLSLIEKLGIDYKQGQDPQDLVNPLQAKPFAQAYAGHQFGYFTNLGDGRAMILGEHQTPDNLKFDIQLKGSGRTMYSRGGDGKAAMSSMIREYLYSYAMKNMAINTSESLAVIATKQEVIREEIHEGAILIRKMQSHIRIGTFEYVSHYCSFDEFREFTDYVIKRHYPEFVDEKQKYLKLFQEIIKRVTDMVVDWYRVGFIHGVMNTDNISITGETFDYGPCSFMNSYNPQATFSLIDRDKRYSFGNQKNILKWNMNILGRTLIPLFAKDAFLAEKFCVNELEKFDLNFESRFTEMMKNKLGIRGSVPVKSTISRLLLFLEQYNTDYTNTFIELMYPQSMTDKIFQTSEFLKIRSELKIIGSDLNIMKENNPQRILRNYLVEEALEDYRKYNNLHKIYKLLEAVSSPYTKNDDLKKFQKPPDKGFDERYTTHCNT